LYYQKAGGEIPFLEWVEYLREQDPSTVSKILGYLTRVQLGNLGNAKLLPGTGGVSELVMDFGPGWRVYFGQAGPLVVLLLLGGNKRTQPKDIETALKYWNDYKKRRRGAI
jgi:putative addiction module killer protein